MTRWALLLLLLSGCGCVSVPTHNELRATALALRFENGLCAGTAVSPDTLWTAKHCLDSGGALIAVNGQWVKQLEVIELAKDRVAVRIRGITFKRFAKIGPPPHQGQRVRFFGTPGGNNDVYREGYIARAWTDGVIIVAPVCRGDSGSGLLSDAGEVIGVVSAMTNQNGCAFGIAD